MKPNRTAVGTLAVVFLLANGACFRAGESDAQLQKKIEQALRSDPSLTGQRVGVAVQNGVAALLGGVETPEQVQAAIRDANLKGIVQIVNEVRASPPLATLTVNETGQGSVTSADGKINCSNGGGACSASYPAGTTVTLNAAAASGWKPQGWNGGTPEACKDPNACAVTMNGGVSVMAAFVPATALPSPGIVSPPPPPSITASAEPPSVTAGNASTLTWRSSGAVRMTLDGKSVPLQSSVKVSPPATRAYVLVATNRSGVATTFRVPIGVSSVPAPTISLRLDPSSIVAGQRATLTWASTNAVSVTINRQTQAANGSMIVSPGVATNYQAIATNTSGQTAVGNAFLNVIESIKVTVPAGTDVFIRMIDTVDSTKVHDGDVFRASLEQGLQADGYVVARKGTDVTGRVIEVKQPNRILASLGGTIELQLELVGMRDANGRMQTISTETMKISFSNAKGNLIRGIVGGGIGASIGAIVGGGKGAAVGGGAGAGGGEVWGLIFGKDKIVISSEHVCRFRLRQPLVITVRPQ